MGDKTRDALVDERGVRRYGQLAARPTVVNPLDEFSGPKGRLKRLRLKEWIGFTLIHPGLASSMIIQDAHYLASSELYVAELGSGRLSQHARTARGGSVGFAAALWGRPCVFRKPGYNIEYEFAPVDGTHRIRIDVAATDTAAAISGELELDGAHTAPPLSVSSRLPGGAMYTHKMLYPASGALRIGDVQYSFDPTRDLAILDEHHSLFPYRTFWTWGTFAEMTPDGPIGANVCRRPELPAEPGESCIWTSSALEPLSDVTFASDSEGRWQIASRDGGLDVTFTPDGRKEVKHQLGVVAIDYVQLYGTYRGVLRNAPNGYEFTAVRGVYERMDTRF
jgi:hypothetical protein